MKLHELFPHSPEQRAKISKNMDIVKAFNQGFKTGNAGSSSDSAEDGSDDLDSIVSEPTVNTKDLKLALKFVANGGSLNVDQKNILTKSIQGKEKTELYRTISTVIQGKPITTHQMKIAQSASQQL
jgi:hypothetical protein